jgi:hypothetical protein
MSKRKSLSQVFRQLLRSNAEEKKAEPIEESQEVPKASNGASPNLTKAPDLSRDIHKSTQHFARYVRANTASADHRMVLHTRPSG